MTHRPLVRSMVTYVYGVACPRLQPSGTCLAWRFQPHTVPALLSNCFSLPRPGCAWHKFLDRTSYDEAPDGLLLAGWPAVWAALVVCVPPPPGTLKQCSHIHDACGSEQCVVVTLIAVISSWFESCGVCCARQCCASCTCAINHAMHGRSMALHVALVTLDVVWREDQVQHRARPRMRNGSQSA